MNYRSTTDLQLVYLSFVLYCYISLLLLHVFSLFSCARHSLYVFSLYRTFLFSLRYDISAVFLISLYSVLFIFTIFAFSCYFQFYSLVKCSVKFSFNCHCIHRQLTVDTISESNEIFLIRSVSLLLSGSILASIM